MPRKTKIAKTTKAKTVKKSSHKAEAKRIEKFFENEGFPDYVANRPTSWTTLNERLVGNQRPTVRIHSQVTRSH